LPAGDADLSFRVKADATSLPVALASMLAKFLREACMDCFNAWWRQRLPALRPTAGYPQDAVRFLADLAPIWDGQTPPRTALWREK
jgi:ribonuclease HII